MVTDNDLSLTDLNSAQKVNSKYVHANAIRLCGKEIT